MTLGPTTGFHDIRGALSNTSVSLPKARNRNGEVVHDLAGGFPVQNHVKLRHVYSNFESKE